MKLLYKELMLAAHPTSIVFAFLGCLVVVPAYPYTVIFMFGCLAPYITFLYARETNDAWYTAVLPVTKRESVKGKCQLIVSIQLFQLLISIPCVILRGILEVENNPVGIDATVAWYGFGLIIYAVFDLVFFPAYYKNGYKAGKAFVLAAIPMSCSRRPIQITALTAIRTGEKLTSISCRTTMRQSSAGKSLNVPMRF